MSRGRPSKPIKLHLAEGNPSHLTKQEIEDRQNGEIVVPFTDIVPPSHLNKKQKEKFMDIAKKLRAIGIMTELDADCLSMYVFSYDLYLEYTKKMLQLMKTDDIDGVKDLQVLQDKAFRQANTAARDMGLTITSRCKIVIPKPPEEDEEL